jgi:hypothetical protein
MAADQMKGEKGSLYIKTTGKQNRNAIVSIRSIVLRIRIISRGLISFILRFSYFEDTNIMRITKRY